MISIADKTEKHKTKLAIDELEFIRLVRCLSDEECEEALQMIAYTKQKEAVI